MKKFTKSEIDRWRAYFEGQGFKQAEAEVGDHKFGYFVLPQSLEPRLKNFVFRCTGEPFDGELFGVSESMDERFRPYAVAHEVIEFKKIGIDTCGRCAMALDEELKLVPKEIKQEYIKMRRDFFRDLVKYCERKPEHYNESDIDEFKQTLARLEELTK